MKKILSVFFATSLIMAFVSCNEEDIVIDKYDRGLTLSSNTVVLSMHLGITSATVTIESGAGDYNVDSSDETVITASLSGATITINAVAQGEATIIVTDGEEDSEVITVNVVYESPTSATFTWGVESIEFDQTDGHGISVLSSSVALTDLALSQRQYLLSWTGGFSEGSKTDGKLEIIILGRDLETISLTSIKVIQARPTGYYVIFEDGDKSGELFFIK